jgi:hypothetical protein
LEYPSERLLEASNYLFHLSQLAFPHYQNLPAELLQGRAIAPVSRDVPLEFLKPERHIRGWGGGSLATFVAMPETSMNEDHSLVFRENYIWGSRQVPSMDAKAVTHRV